MGFLAPVVPFLGKIGAALGGKAALGKAGLSIGSSILGSKLSGGSGGVPGVQNLLDEQLGAIKQGREIATNLQPQAQNLLNIASQTYSPVADHWGRLLSGNRGQMTESLAPEIGQINRGYQATSQAASNLMPRGGGRSAFFSEMPFQRQRDISTLFQQARPQAAQGLLQAGAQAGGAGQGIYSAILSALSGAGAGTSGLLSYDLQSRAGQYERGKELGGTIFDLLQNLPIFKKGKGGAPEESFSY